MLLEKQKMIKNKFLKNKYPSMEGCDETKVIFNFAQTDSLNLKKFLWNSNTTSGIRNV